MTSYVEHPSKASRWRDGGFEVHPAAATANLVVWVGLEPGTDGTPQWEGLLAVPTRANRAVIAAVPAFAYDLNLGDEVDAIASAEGALVVTKIVHDAGHVTFRVWLAPTASEDDRRWHQLQIDLASFRCWFDVFSPRLIALSAEPGVAQDVAGWLQAAENAGTLTYEAGRSTMPLK